MDQHPLSADRDCLFDIRIYLPHMKAVSSIRNLKVRPAVVTGIHLTSK
jgi:hypothetical protein